MKDEEIRGMILDHLAYEISALYTPGRSPGEEKNVRHSKELRRKLRRGELCLRCHNVPAKHYNPKARKHMFDKGFCQVCHDYLVEKGQLCNKCQYAFPLEMMHGNNLCKLCQVDEKSSD